MNIDQLIRSKRKTVALIVEKDGRLVVRAPLRTPETVIREFVERKAGWIRKKQAEVRQSNANVVVHRYEPGEEFGYLGKNYRLEVVEGARHPLSLNGRFQIDRRALAKAPLVFQKWYRQQAEQVIGERVQVFARQFGLRYRSVKITSAQRRWGSCSAQGGLCFSWRLVLAPVEVIDYVVVHELAHLIVRNHSQAFWAKVEEMMPDYKKRREWLKGQG